MMIRFAKAWGAILALVLIYLGTGAFGSGEQRKRDGYEILYNAKAERWRGARRDVSAARTFIGAGEEGSTGFDILHYRIDIEIDPGDSSVAGTVEVRFRVSTAALDSIFLHLTDDLSVASVHRNGSPLSFQHVQHEIHIDLGGTFLQDETLSVEVAYGGFPNPNTGLRFREEAIYNLSEPDLARDWFPCYDEPWDKATSEMIVTVPDTLFCASNGLLISETDNLNGTKTYHWSTQYRQPTYTISVAISNYVFFSHWYHYTPSDSMEMPYYVYPRKLAAAQISFSNAPGMMEFFSETFGQYPFVNEKYGTALVPLGGAMENFTCTSFGSGLIYGTHDYDWVVAHELAHSWFGNSVTLADWREIWINEGFATYSDALWHEHTGGQASLDQRMTEFRDDYFAEDAMSRFPIYDPALMWGATVYKKGAWILHMLRYVLGDSVFFETLRTYHSTYAYQNATTEDFRAICEAMSGLNLSSFFAEWIYQAGYPEYEYAWGSFSNGLGYHLNLEIVQTQTNAPVFTVPIEIRVTTASSDTIARLPVGGPFQTHQLAFDEEPVTLEFDPFDRILKTAVEVPAGVASSRRPPRLSAVVYPNPTSGSARLDVFLPAPGDAVLEIYDAAGRFVGRTAERGLRAAWNSFELGDGAGGLAFRRSGVYFYRLISGGQTTTGKLTVVR